MTATDGSLYHPGVRKGDVPPLTNELCVHLEVATPGEQGRYQEFDVPYDPDEGPGTWRWPPRV